MFCFPTLLPIANCSSKLEVIFCVQAVIAPPRGASMSTLAACPMDYMGFYGKIYSAPLH